MSDPIDFAAILGDRLAHSIQGEPITDIYTPTGVGTYQLAGKVPGLCPDCKGRGRTAAVRRLSLPVDCSHPNAPTLGRMLAEWQPLMALAEAVDAALTATEAGYAQRLFGQDAQRISTAHLALHREGGATWDIDTGHRNAPPEQVCDGDTLA